MKSRKLLLSLALMSALALVLWQLNRHKTSPAPSTAPVAQAPVPAVTPAAASPGKPAAEDPVAVAAVVAPAAAPVPATVVPVSHPGTSTPLVQSPAESVAAAPALSPEAQAEELAATARMYAAHAPLRVPEVADPDSTSNRQILGTMVAKTLAQPATPPPDARSNPVSKTP